MLVVQQKIKLEVVGFQNVIAADGNVANLKELNFTKLSTRNMENLIYVSGEIISTDLEKQLVKSRDMNIKRIINYRTSNHNERL